MTAATAEAVRKAWGTQLRAERDRRQLTQEDLATETGLDQGSVSRAESGGGSFETYIRLATALGVTLEVAS